jgi:hypothetical protein
MPHLPEDLTMLHICVEKENWLVQCGDFEPKKQRFSWKKLGKDEALVLAKKARDLQVEKRRYNAELKKKREIAEAEEEEKERIARNKAIDELEEKREEEERMLRIQKEVEKRSAVYKIVLPDDLDEDRRRLITRDLFITDYKYFGMTLEQLENELPTLIKQYDMISPWDRVWLGLQR